MRRAQPEMTEIDHTEYVFGENGGRGAPPSQFFRRVANMAPTVDGEQDSQQRVVGGFSHLTKQASAKAARTKSKDKDKDKDRKKGRKDGSFFDLDDDWDANLEQYESSSRRQNAGQTAAETAAMAEIESINSAISRIMRFETVLEAPTVNLDHLRKLAYSGVPSELRPRTWQHLLGYLPQTAERRDRALARKRQEYLDGVKQVFSRGLDEQMWHQISIDVPRTNPNIKLYTQCETQRALERILYLWAIRHPASGYVQGINDLVTPFYQTFLAQYVGFDNVEDADPMDMSEDIRNAVEADSYWCLTKLLDGIQDNYIHAQPGIHKQVAMLQDLCQRIDVDLAKHFQREGLEFMQFSFRWMNCLLMREVPMRCTVRIWDTYLGEGSQGFSEFHVYVCAAFLVRWSKEIKQMDFQDMMIFLQSLPTKDWGDKEVELILSQAYMWQSLFKNAVAHLK